MIATRTPDTAGGTVTISIRIPRAHRDAIEQIAQRAGLTRSAHIALLIKAAVLAERL